MQRLWPYLAVIVLSSLLLVYSLRLWRADLTVPFVNGGEGDTTYELAVAKGIIETGWHTHTPRASAPGELDNKDFPRPDSLHFLLWRLFASIYANPAFIFNAVGFLSYPLAAFTMTLVLRQLGISRLVAVAFGILYAFLPFHMARWTAGHMLLVMYYTVPLLALVALWIVAGRLPFFESNEGRTRFRPFTLRTLVAVLIALLAGSTSVYFAFFGCFFMVVGGLVASCRLRSYAPITSALMVSALCGATMTVNTLPNRQYVQEQGLNCVVATRVPEEADIYGLRVAQLLLPRPEHRFDAFEYLRTKYEGRGIPEGANNALGLIGVIGFLSLLLALLVRRGANDLFDHLAVFLVAGILLGTIGAFGSLFNFLINADIRAYNRIVVFLAFFSFTASALMVDRWLSWESPFGRLGRALRVTPFSLRGRVVMCLLLTAFGFWDQTSGKVPTYSRNTEKYKTREAFVQQVESQVPYGAMIFQVPFLPYTEAGSIHNMPDYSPALCYVHSHHTRWTYPAFSNRRWARWQEWVSEQPVPQMVRTLCLADFQGIHIDRRGYADRAKQLMSELQTLLQQEPLQSKDEHYLYFDFTTYANKLRAELGTTEWHAEAHRIRERPYYSFQAGFRLGSRYRDGVYLSAVRSKLAVGNPSSTTQPMRLTMNLRRLSQHPSNLRLRGLGSEWTIQITSTSTTFTFDLEVPPGQHTLESELETSGTMRFMPNRLTEVWLAEKVTLERR